MATDDLETRWLRFLNDVLGESPNVKRDVFVLTNEQKNCKKRKKRVDQLRKMVKHGFSPRIDDDLNAIWEPEKIQENEMNKKIFINGGDNSKKFKP